MEFFIPLLFFIIWFLGWIFNLNDQNKQKGGNAPQRGQQPRQQRQEGRQRLQNEIDDFLNEIGAKREQKNDDGVEIVRHDRIRQERQEQRRREQQERREQQRRQEEQRREQRQQQSRRPKPADQRPSHRSSISSSSSSRQRPGGNVSNREAPGHKDLGSGVTSHVDQYMNSHIQQYMAARKSGLSQDQATRALSRELSDEQVADAEKRLSEQNFQDGSPSVVMAGELHPANIVKLMQNPQTVRTAIIMNEILQRPKSLQQ